jgi:Zn-dependent protease with chaperone function
MNAETMRFRRKRLTILAVVCAAIGLPFVLASHRGAVAFDIGATLVGIGAGLFVVALLFSPLSRLNK